LSAKGIHGRGWNFHSPILKFGGFALLAFFSVVKWIQSSASPGSLSSAIQKDFMTGDKIRFKQIPPAQGYGENTLRYAAYIENDGGKSSVSFAEWIQAMKSNSNSVAETMTIIIRSAPYQALRFETPGVSVETVHQKPFEFVLVNDPHLGQFAAQQDPDTFAEHLECKGATLSDHGPAACAFVNLGGDARLVAPRNWNSDPPNNNYHGHIAKFMRGGSMEQVIQVWGVVASTLEDELLGDAPTRAKSKPLWFSTAGDGVAWLHFRLDSRPKYYLYRPFGEFS
jgi:hypothetical protein